MSPKVTTVDYGTGNLLSIANAIAHCGAEMVLTNSTGKIARAERLILPGVGAFKTAMDSLREHGLVDAIQKFAQTGRPFLGICVGMQMMLDVSEEFGEHKGLGLIPGRVIPIPPTGADGIPHKIPHIGWNVLRRSGGCRSWDGTILEKVPRNMNVYFVHSFTAVPQDEKHRLADTFYNGRRISAVIGKGHLYGNQFHPEKSGKNGLKIIKKFVEL